MAWIDTERSEAPARERPRTLRCRSLPMAAADPRCRSLPMAAADRCRWLLPIVADGRCRSSLGGARGGHRPCSLCPPPPTPRGRQPRARPRERARGTRGRRKQTASRCASPLAIAHRSVKHNVSRHQVPNRPDRPYPGADRERCSWAAPLLGAKLRKLEVGHPAAASRPHESGHPAAAFWL